VQQLLRSEEPLDRFGALIDLRDLIEGRDARIADAATQALRKLTTDDSRRVAAAAQRLLAEEEGRAAAIAAGEPVGPASVEAPPPASDASPESSLEPMVPIAAGASPKASDEPWSLGRAAARAAIGSIAATVLAFVWWIAGRLTSDSEIDLEAGLSDLVQLTAWVAFIATAIVTVAEAKLPAARLPGGDAYQVAGGNRFVAAAILGAIVGLTVGFAVYIFVLQTTDVIGFNIPICFAAGFVIAEAVVGHRFSASAKGDVQAP
jgi:hypothetical protein